MAFLALVVDDSMLVRHTVGRYLEEQGFRVESAANGVEGLEVLARMRPDVIITDMQMPGMDGSEFISALKSQSATANIPIVILAGRASGFDKKEKRADFVIHKDIDIIEQLEKALAATVPGTARGQASGK